MKKTCTKTCVIALLLAIIMTPAAATSQRMTPTHYLDENKSGYEAYQAANPEIPYNIIVAYVNAKTDKPYYSEIETVANPTSISVYLSKNYALPYGYEPDDLVTLPGGEMLRAEAAEAYSRMKEAATSEGLTLAARSSYRSHGSQIASYELVASNYGIEGAEASVARAGHSEHETGLALDILHKHGTTGPLTGQGFDTSEEYVWLLENGYKYGFILRYPEKYVHIHGYVYEPWHWRYVGLNIAMAMRREGITTFDEYYGKYLAPGVIMKSRISRAAQSYTTYAQ